MDFPSPGFSSSWGAGFWRGAPSIRIQEQTKDAARLDFPPQYLTAKAPILLQQRPTPIELRSFIYPTW
jgi:hypothetical protein